MNQRILVALGATAIACGAACSSSKSSGPDDTCGNAPYVQVAGVVQEFQIGPYRNKEGVTATIDLCPGRSFKTDADGKLSVHVSKSAPFIVTFEHPDDIPMVFEELSYDADFTDGSAYLIPTSYQSIVVPQLDANTAVLALQINFPAGALDAGATNDCLKPDGVTWSIPGHPEAKVIYFTADAVPKQDTTLTATTTSGVTGVLGLTDGTIVEPVATKPGCTITTKHNGFTGRTRMKNGHYASIFGLMTK